MKILRVGKMSALMKQSLRETSVPLILSVPIFIQLKQEFPTQFPALNDVNFFEKINHY